MTMHQIKITQHSTEEVEHEHGATRIISINIIIVTVSDINNNKQ